MQPFTAFAVYMVMWWTLIFAVLPWGVRRAEAEKQGHDRGAPAQPYLMKKVLWTTVVTSVVWIGFFLVNHYDLVSFRQIFGR